MVAFFFFFFFCFLFSLVCWCFLAGVGGGGGGGGFFPQEILINLFLNFRLICWAFSQELFVDFFLHRNYWLLVVVFTGAIYPLLKLRTALTYLDPQGYSSRNPAVLSHRSALPAYDNHQCYRTDTNHALLCIPSPTPPIRTHFVWFLSCGFNPK